MGQEKTLYAIAESCPFDAILVRDMKRSVNSLLQLNLKRFRVPQKNMTKYSALDVMKQALELLFEFSPSERSYREAMRTITVYSEGDEEMVRTLKESFFLVANAVYNAYNGQRHAESLAPEILFLQGIPFDPAELQQSFRFVGVRPPDVSPPSVRKTLFLDEGFEPYRLMLEGKLRLSEMHGREEHWAELIESALSGELALIRVGVDHIGQTGSIGKGLTNLLRQGETGKLPQLLREKGIQINVISRTADVNKVFGRNM